MTYILIIYIYGWSAGVLDHIEFNSKQACVAAAEKILNSGSDGSKRVYCVEKGKP